MARYYISGPPASPIARIIASILGVLVVVGAIIFGFFLLAAAAALGLLLWIGLSVRGWWLRRKVGEKSRPEAGKESDVIEAEYTVISRRRD